VRLPVCLALMVLLPAAPLHAGGERVARSGSIRPAHVVGTDGQTRNRGRWHVRSGRLIGSLIVAALGVSLGSTQMAPASANPLAPESAIPVTRLEPMPGATRGDRRGTLLAGTSLTAVALRTMQLRRRLRLRWQRSSAGQLLEELYRYRDEPAELVDITERARLSWSDQAPLLTQAERAGLEELHGTPLPRLRQKHRWLEYVIARGEELQERFRTRTAPDSQRWSDILERIWASGRGHGELVHALHRLEQTEQQTARRIALLRQGLTALARPRWLAGPIAVERRQVRDELAALRGEQAALRQLLATHRQRLTAAVTGELRTGDGAMARLLDQAGRLSTVRDGELTNARAALQEVVHALGRAEQHLDQAHDHAHHAEELLARADELRWQYPLGSPESEANTHRTAGRAAENALFVALTQVEATADTLAIALEQLAQREELTPAERSALQVLPAAPRWSSSLGELPALAAAVRTARTAITRVEQGLARVEHATGLRLQALDDQLHEAVERALAHEHQAFLDGRRDRGASAPPAEQR
jgi:hypothetical protein